MPRSSWSSRTAFRNAALWVIANILVGCSPLIFLKAISVLSEENIAVKEIEQLIKDKALLFGACVLMGAVVLDAIFSPLRVKGWFPVFAIYVSPFCILLYLFLKYLLVYVQFGDQHDFGPGLWTTRFTIAYSILYCFFVKAIMNIQTIHARRHLDI